jgi:hypothetical protein
MSAPNVPDFTGGLAAWIPALEKQEAKGSHSRELDREIGKALGWRVSCDEWWNWRPGPVYDPPGDEWCIRKDGRKDRPCNEALPWFTAAMLRQMIQEHL